MTEVNVGLEAVMNTYFEYVGCTQCSLCHNRKTKDVLAGFGSASADLMFILDVPSLEDDANQQFLSDAAGKFLMNLIEMVWYEDDVEMDKVRDLYGESYFEAARDYISQHIFFTSVVACPPEDKVKATKKQNETCMQRVNKLIYQIDPLLVVCFGSEAAKYVFGKGDAPNTHGIIQQFEVPSLYSNRTVKYAGMVTFHPKHVLNAGDQNLIDQEKGMTYNTMQDVRKALQLVKTHKELQ